MIIPAGLARSWAGPAGVFLFVIYIGIGERRAHTQQRRSHL